MIIPKKLQTTQHSGHVAITMAPSVSRLPSWWHLASGELIGWILSTWLGISGLPGTLLCGLLVVSRSHSVVGSTWREGIAGWQRIGVNSPSLFAVRLPGVDDVGGLPCPGLPELTVTVLHASPRISLWIKERLGRWLLFGRQNERR